MNDRHTAHTQWQHEENLGNQQLTTLATNYFIVFSLKISHTDPHTDIFTHSYVRRRRQPIWWYLIKWFNRCISQNDTALDGWVDGCEIQPKKKKKNWIEIRMAFRIRVSDGGRLTWAPLQFYIFSGFGLMHIYNVSSLPLYCAAHSV